jgi:hypothetical protein
MQLVPFHTSSSVNRVSGSFRTIRSETIKEVR